MMIPNVLRSFLVLSVLSLFGARPVGLTPAVPSEPERLVAEAMVREYDTHEHLYMIYLPVTIHGHAGTILLFFTQMPADVVLSEPMLTRFGIALPEGAPLDSLTIGTVVAHGLTKKIVGDGMFGPIDSLQQPDLPPVVGFAGNTFLAHYDIVVDGPAHRVRLYAPLPASSPPPARRHGGLPPWVQSADCSPTRPMPKENTGFVLRIEGHPVIGVLSSSIPHSMMNQVAATLVGLTEQSPKVLPIPDSIRDRFDDLFDSKLLTTGIHVTLGRHLIKDVHIHISPDVPLELSPTTPTIELTQSAFIDQIFMMSYSTGQACLSRPGAVRP